MADRKKSRAVGFNHVAQEVGDIDEALAFFGSFLHFELRSQSENMAFIDLGDQFLALSKGRRQGRPTMNATSAWWWTTRRPWPPYSRTWASR